MKIRQAAKRFFPSTNLSTGINIFDQELKGHRGFPRGSLTLLTGADAFALGLCFSRRMKSNKNFEVVFVLPDTVFDHIKKSKEIMANNKAVLVAAHDPQYRLMCHANVTISSSYIGDSQYLLEMIKNRFSYHKPRALIKVNGYTFEVIDSMLDA